MVRNTRRPSDALIWGIFLFVGGLILLLNNLDIFGSWIAWVAAAAFAVAGLYFVGRFVGNRRQWWPIIPGLTLLGLAATIFLSEQGLVPQAWLATIFLGGIGLGFWIIFILDRAHWWAVIPGGMLWVIAILAVINQTTKLDNNQQGGLLFIGLGLVFGILYLLRNAQRPLGWAAIPALALIVFGVIAVTAEGGTSATNIGKFWPLLAVAIGLGLLLGQLRTVGTVTVTIPSPGKKAVQPVPPPQPVVESSPAPVVPVEELEPIKPPPATSTAEAEKPPEEAEPPKPENLSPPASTAPMP
ncbi:MAG: hypothetical protein IT330_17380 [Anaerolineae bacterium]|nr:hypothetical protein [Anaerolineae bacterium]